jgi:hypothetical protein
MTVPRDEHEAQTEVLIDILGHRDALLRAAQHFLNALTEEDVDALDLQQKDYLLDLAMYAGCTNLSWWKLPKSEMQDGPIIG